MNLNDRALRICDRMLSEADALRISAHVLDSGARVIDCGVNVSGGLEAGRQLAEVCLAGLGSAHFAPVSIGDCDFAGVIVRTDHPTLACMASQYAGWELKLGDYFAMGSGPMRAAAAREPLFEALNYRESAAACVGVLESDRLPTDDVCTNVATKCGIEPERLTLLVAPTTSLAGAIQIVARSIETALHKLHELQFDLGRIESAWGAAPLPPPGADAMTAIGRTNDAILYGGQAVLYVRGDDASLETTGRQTPSSASSDYGRPFAETLARYNNDFYQVDPLLFSPAKVTFVNLDTGNAFQFGAFNTEVLAESFGVSGDAQ